MTLEETLTVPYSMLVDLMAIEQFKIEGAKLIAAGPEDPETEEDEFWRLMSRR